MTITEDWQMGRAKNAVLSFLEHRLSVPKIYIDANWSNQHVDVLAIDRDGVGDVHGVLLFPRQYPNQVENSTRESGDIDRLISRLRSIEVQFKYIAVIDVEIEKTGSYRVPLQLSDQQLQSMFAQDFIGRVGILRVHLPLQGEPSVWYELGAERFRAAVSRLADEYIEQHTADWEIRA